jgi:hypothetical protein
MKRASVCLYIYNCITKYQHTEELIKAGLVPLNTSPKEKWVWGTSSRYQYPLKHKYIVEEDPKVYYSKERLNNFWSTTIRFADDITTLCYAMLF